MNLEKLEEILKNNNEPAFRLVQIKKAIFTDGISDFSEITTISKDLREILKKEIDILPFTPENILVSADKRSIKALLKLKDGNFIETVLISPKPDIWSACISSQVGCLLGCAFCATGQLGFKRNLTAEEITDQVLFWKQYLNSEQKNKIDTVVFMGMGEPFLNWKNVRQSLKDLINPDSFGFGSRSISVSTAGIPEGIKNLAEDFPQVNLAISLHFAADEERNKYMPINKKYNLSKLRDSLQNYFKTSNRKVFLEYIMLKNINDSREDADSLIQYLKSIGKPHLLHVNLIRYNSTSGTSGELSPSEISIAREFKNYLSQSGINATIRKSLGEDISGACGQLAGSQNGL